MEDFYCPFVEHFSMMPIGIAFVTAIVLLILLARFGLLKRKNPLYRFFVALYYIYIPLVFLAGGFMVSTFSSFEIETKRSIEAYGAEINAVALAGLAPTLKELSSEKDTGSLSAKALVGEVSTRLVRNFILPELEDVSSLLNEFAGRGEETKILLEEMLASNMAAALEKKLINEAAEKSGVDKQALLTFWTKDISKSIEDGLIVSALHAMTAKLMKMVLTAVLIPLGALLLIPFIEILLYALFNRKKKATGEESATA